MILLKSLEKQSHYVAVFCAMIKFKDKSSVDRAEVIDSSVSSVSLYSIFRPGKKKSKEFHKYKKMKY